MARYGTLAGQPLTWVRPGARGGYVAGAGALVAFILLDSDAQPGADSSRRQPWAALTIDVGFNTRPSSELLHQRPGDSADGRQIRVGIVLFIDGATGTVTEVNRSSTIQSFIGIAAPSLPNSSCSNRAIALDRRPRVRRVVRVWASLDADGAKWPGVLNARSAMASF